MNSKKHRKGFANRSVAITAAVLIHAVIVAFLVINFTKSYKSVTPADTEKIDTITATTVSSADIRDQQKKIEKAEQEKKRKAEEQRKQEQRKLDDLKKKQQQEKQRLKKLEQERKQKEAIALKKKKEQERKAEEERKKKEQERKKAEQEKKKEQERKKKEEADRKRREAEEQKKREAEELQRREDAKRQALQNELDKEFQQQQNVSSNNQAASNSASLVSKYAALIQQKVQDNFVAPLGTPVGRSAQFRLRLDNVGRVQSTDVTRSSGNFEFDRAVQVAIGRSSPLPLPKDDAAARSQLQDLLLTFTYNP